MTPDPAEMLTEWIADLRSGEIEQCTSQLARSDGRRCCLGVAYDIAVRHGYADPPKDVSTFGSAVLMYCWTKDDVVHAETVGLPPHIADLFRDAKDWALGIYAEMNDEGKSFKQIALAIERKACALGLL